MARPHRRHLLHQGDAVHAEIERPALSRRGQGGCILEPLDTRATPADVGLHQNRKPEPGSRGDDRGRAVREPSLRVWDAEFFEYLELQRLGGIHLVRGSAVDDWDADALEVAEPLQRIERRLPVTTQVCRRTRTIEDERIRRRAFPRIVRVRRGIEPHIWHASPIQLGEQRAEPIGVLVEDGDRVHGDSRIGEVRRINER